MEARPFCTQGVSFCLRLFQHFARWATSPLLRATLASRVQSSLVRVVGGASPSEHRKPSVTAGPHQLHEWDAEARRLAESTTRVLWCFQGSLCATDDATSSVLDMPRERDAARTHPHTVRFQNWGLQQVHAQFSVRAFLCVLPKVTTAARELAVQLRSWQLTAGAFRPRYPEDRHLPPYAGPVSDWICHKDDVQGCAPGVVR